MLVIILYYAYFMKTESVLGVLGAALSAAGLVASIYGAKNGAWTVLVLGLLLIALALRAFLMQRPLNYVHVSYKYEIEEPSGNLAKVSRVVRVRALSRHLTTLWARSLTTTGQYRNFRSNMGKVSLEESTGGGQNVRVDLDRPLKLGAEICWKLTYEAVGAFTQKVESVSISGMIGQPHAELAIKFHPESVPRLVRRTIFYRGFEHEEDPVFEPTPESPEVIWTFKIRQGAEHSLRWERPSP